MSQITGELPRVSIFQTGRYGEFTYTIPTRTPNTAQTVTLYFEVQSFSDHVSKNGDLLVNISPMPDGTIPQQ